LTLRSVYWEAVRLAGYGVEDGYDAVSTVQKKPVLGKAAAYGYSCTGAAAAPDRELE
jgi:hypothetical protein